MIKDLIVCVPTYNEEESIGDLIDVLTSHDLEFFICDGYSSDQTVNIARKKNATIISRTEHGKGVAIIESLKYAQSRGYKYLALIDCDFSYRVEDLVRLFPYKDENELVIGIRNFKDITFLRRLANQMFNIILNTLFSGRLNDVHSGLRILEISKFIDHLDTPEFEIETQITIVALKNRYSVKEVLVGYHPRRGTSKVSVWAIIGAFKLIAREKFKPLASID